MSLRLTTAGSVEAVWLSLASSLKVLDQPLLRCLATTHPMVNWEYRQHPDEPCGLEAAVVLLYDYLKNQDRPIHLVGHSLGGVVGLLFAHQYPQWIRSLTLLGVSPQPATTWHAHYYVQRLLFPCSREQLLIRTATSLVGTQTRCRIRSLAEGLRKDLDTSPVLHSLFKINPIPPSPLSVPTLICGSQDDPIVDLDALHRWENQLNPHDHLWVCPGGRHFFHYSYATSVATRIRAFWEGISLGKTSPLLVSKLES